MAEFQIYESPRFLTDLEEALVWLYSHNFEQSEEFADKKFFEMKQELNGLKNHLKQTPYIGQADAVSGLRRFPMYDGRYFATWVINEKSRAVTLLEFIDTQYPKELRYGKIVRFDED